MAESTPRRFILQAIHPEYGCPALEAMFVVEKLEELRELLGPDAEEDQDLEYFYTLEPNEVAAINQRFDIGFDPLGRTAYLYKWTESRNFPYLIHAGYELLLMLEGRKQFARMYLEYPPMQHHHEEGFDRYVAQGLLYKEVEIKEFDRPVRSKDGRLMEGIRTAYYTRKGEEWRIQAWQMIEAASRKTGWNDTLERLEGMLFGYEDWQNDWWIEKIWQRKYQFGTLLVWLAISDLELAGIENAGYRALPPMNRTLHLVSEFEEDPNDKEPLRLMEADGALALVRLRVKAKAFLDLVEDGRDRFHQLPADRIGNLNGILVENIEVVMTRGG